MGWRACRVAAVRIGESAEDRSWDGAEERADEGTGLPWAKVEGHRAGVHRAGSGDPLPIVQEHAPLSAGANADHGVEVKTTQEHENREADRGFCGSSC